MSVIIDTDAGIPVVIGFREAAIRGRRFRHMAIGVTVTTRGTDAFVDLTIAVVISIITELVFSGVLNPSAATPNSVLATDGTRLADANALGSRRTIVATYRRGSDNALTTRLGAVGLTAITVAVHHGVRIIAIGAGSAVLAVAIAIGIDAKNTTTIRLGDGFTRIGFGRNDDWCRILVATV